MKIAIGADHGGYKLKRSIARFLKDKGYYVKDFGTYSKTRCDYPPIGYRVASQVAKGVFERGILICKSGLGMSIVSNKIRGVRAALISDARSARSSREHNNANIAVFSGDVMSPQKACTMLTIWLNTDFLGGRHARRIRQISGIEKKIARKRWSLRRENANVQKT
ncbi:MAG: ribose 5-phosphate isomerase B [Candidatus Omnitrophica bacterium]|nr:ribose 5-phosphate isomerase B [Candidatus Omnitrophota bacterium]